MNNKNRKAHEFLCKYGYVKKRIEAKNRELESFKFRMRNILNGTNAEEKSRALQSILSSEQYLQEQIYSLNILLKNISEVIKMVENERYKLILEEIYINGTNINKLTKIMWLSAGRLRACKVNALTEVYKILIERAQ